MQNDLLLLSISVFLQFWSRVPDDNIRYEWPQACHKLEQEQR